MEVYNFTCILYLSGHLYVSAPELSITEELFGESNVTVILKYQEDAYNESGYGVTIKVSVEVIPQVTVVSNGTQFELVLLYNTLYNISAYVTLCGLTGPSRTSEVFYGEYDIVYFNSKTSLAPRPSRLHAIILRVII